MAPRNESTFYRAELTGRSVFEYVVGLALGILLWVVNSMSATSTLVFDPAWTAVGLACGLALLAVVTFSKTGVAFKRRFRESTGFFVAVMTVAIIVVLLSVYLVDVTVRPVHYSWYLGLGLGQLVGIALYLRQRAAG